MFSIFCSLLGLGEVAGGGERLLAYKLIPGLSFLVGNLNNVRMSHWKESRKLCRYHNKDKGLGVEKEHNKNLGVTAIYKILNNEREKKLFSIMKTSPLASLCHTAKF